MKKVVRSCCFLLLWGSLLMAQQTPVVDTLLYNGPAEKRINFVILGDGYQEHELATFRTDARAIVEKLFGEPPLSNYKPYFNVFAVEVVSNESGVTHPGTASDEPVHRNYPITKADTYFGSTFDYAGVHRLLVATNEHNIMSVLATSVPDYDQVFVIVNTEIYGGSGGNAISTISRHKTSADIAYHELGHSFAGLADEYDVAGWAGEGANIARTAERSTLPWRQWANDTVPLPTPRSPDYENIVGAFPRAYNDSDERGFIPTQNCKMQYIFYPFCPVCSEYIVERIHDLVSPLDSITPAVTDVVLLPDETRVFALHLLHPTPSSLRTTWTLDGAALAHTADSLPLAMEQLSIGQHVLSAVVTDTTSYSRAARHSSEHSHLVQWNINKLATSVEIQPTQTAFQLFTTPNPFTDALTMRYNLSRSAHVRIELRDLHGKLCAVLLDEQQQSGQHSYSSALYHHLAHGTYAVQTLLNGILVSHNLVLHQ